MADLQVRANTPFDEIKHTDEQGNEYWLGRELMPLMAYRRWEDFQRIIKRAQAAAINTGNAVDQAFSVVTEKGTGGRVREDYRLTRFAAYLVAMNGDPNKYEVAQAQAYFAVKTREAEARPTLTGNLAVLEGMLYELHETQHRVGRVEIAQQRQAEEHHVLESRVDSLEGHTGWLTTLAYVRKHQLPSNREYCKALGIKASALCRIGGITPSKAPDERFGEVNCYPEEILDRAVEAMTRVAA